MKDLRDKVEIILQKYPYARDDDAVLSVELWRWFYPHLLEGDTIRLCNIPDLPNQESIGRHRRKFQEEGKYPASQKVQEKRKAHSKTWKRELGYPTQEDIVPIKEYEKDVDSHMRAIKQSLF